MEESLGGVMARPKTKVFNLRIRVEYVAYYQIEAENLEQAEALARDRLSEEVNDQVQGSEDITEYDPKEFE